jgi:hypothetical protein
MDDIRNHPNWAALMGEQPVMPVPSIQLTQQTDAPTAKWALSTQQPLQSNTEQQPQELPINREPEASWSNLGGLFRPEELLDKSAWQDAGRRWGVAGRAAAPYAAAAGAGALTGGGALAGMGIKGLLDLLSFGVNSASHDIIGRPVMASTDEIVDRGLDALNVPRPQGRGEEVVSNLGRAGMGAIAGGPGLAPVLARGMAPIQGLTTAPTLAQRVALSAARNPGAQVAGGVAGQAAVEAIPQRWRGPATDTIANTLGGVIGAHAVPFFEGVPNVVAGSRPMNPEYMTAIQQAMDNRARVSSNPEITRTPQQVENFINDARARNSVSAAFNAALERRNPLDAIANRVAAMQAEDQLNSSVLNPQQAIQNIERTQAEGLNRNIPGYQMGSAAATNDHGVAKFLAQSKSNPRVNAGSDLNQEAIARNLANISSSNIRPEGAYQQAASDRQAAFLEPSERAVAESRRQLQQQQATIQEIQAAKDTAEANLKAEQMRLAENASASQRAAASEAGNAEFFRKNEAFNRRMDATKDPAELSKPISIDPLVQGIEMSKRGSATALENANPEILTKEEQLKRFGATPAASSGAPSVSKTVIAAEPSMVGSVSAMTPERAAQIEASIKAIPEAKGMAKYLQDLGGPVESTIKTPSGQMVKVRRKLVELEDVVRGGKSEAHPAEYQNRDRSTAASQNQVNEIVGRFNPPEITGSNPVATSGAPIVGPQGNVLEGGHARMSALERILTEPGNSAQREAYIAELKKGGHDVSGFKNPVEVQERVTPMTPQEVQGFVQDLNRPTVSALSTTDMAKGDAAALGNSLAKLDPTKPLDHPSNAEFVRSMNSTQLGSTEYASYLKPDGTPNTALTKRYQDALSQAAYGGESKASDALLRSMRDDSDSMVRTIASAMEDSAGGFAKLRQAIEGGQIPKEYDLGTKVADAAAFVRDARRQGIHPLELLKNGDMLGGLDNQTQALVELFYNEGSRRQQGTKALGQTLNQIAAEAMQQDTGLGLGGGVTPDQIIQRGKQSINTKAEVAGAETETSMAKQVEEPKIAPAMAKTEAVSVASAPPETFTVENAAATLESLKSAQREATRNGDHNAARALEAPIKNIEDQLNVEAKNLMAGKALYRTEIAPVMSHGISDSIKRSGPGGDPHGVHPSRFLDQWLTGEPSTKDAKQLVKLMGDTPDNIDAVRQWSISHMASEMREKATGEGIRSWLNKRANVFDQPEFSSIRDEFRRLANQLDNHSETLNRAGKDLQAERQRLKEIESSGSAAESDLAAKRKTSEEAGSSMIASGGAGVEKVLSDPVRAREAVAAATTPEARVDLDNMVRAYIGQKVRNSAPIRIKDPNDPVAVENRVVSMAKAVRELVPAGGSVDADARREALSVLTSPDHVRRLEMLANALESETKQESLIRGNTSGSPTEQQSAVVRMSKAASSWFRRLSMQIIEASKDTKAFDEYVVDIAHSPELTKQILRMRNANDTQGIPALVDQLSRSKVGQFNATASQAAPKWNKRQQAQQDDEESGETPGAPDEKE